MTVEKLKKTGLMKCQEIENCQTVDPAFLYKKIKTLTGKNFALQVDTLKQKTAP